MSKVQKMKEKLWIVISCLAIAAMFAAAIPRIPKAYAFETTLELYSDVTELGPENAVNTTFTVECIVENVTDLYGVDIQIGWTTEYIAYVSHVKKIPIDGTPPHPDGIMYKNTMPVMDQVDETASMSGSEPGTMYWLAEASLSPAKSFNGTGIAFEMTFKVKKHPVLLDSDIYINFTSSTLSGRDAGIAYPIDHQVINKHILLHGQSQPSGPKIEISSIEYKGPVPHIFDVDVSILNLSSYWDLGGYDIQLTFSAEVLQATEIAVDPEGWFASFWPNGIYAVVNETDNTNGKIWVVVLGLPSGNSTHTAPHGSAKLFTVTFNSTASGAPIHKIEDPFSLAAFPHPERPESPFANSPTSVPIPYNATDGSVNIVGVIQHVLEGYTVTTVSNSSVSSIYYKLGVPMLLFNVTGVHGYQGFCNVTIPKNFMWSITSDGWFVLVDGEKVNPIITSDNTNTYIYFTYQQSKHYISIITTSTVPELVLPAMLILALLASALVLTKKLKGKKK
jgi:hypothetical protein